MRLQGIVSYEHGPREFHGHRISFKVTLAEHQKAPHGTAEYLTEPEALEYHESRLIEERGCDVFRRSRAWCRDID